jgi:hypothetical protein
MKNNIEPLEAHKVQNSAAHSYLAQEAVSVKTKLGFLKDYRIPWLTVDTSQHCPRCYLYLSFPCHYTAFGECKILGCTEDKSKGNNPNRQISGIINSHSDSIFPDKCNRQPLTKISKG